MIVSRVMPPRIDAPSGGVIEHAVADEEDVLPAAFADVAVDVERDALGIAVGDRFHLDERGVRVVGRGSSPSPAACSAPCAVPRADLHVDALLERFRAEVGAPFPHHDRGVDRKGSGLTPSGS